MCRAITQPDYPRVRRRPNGMAGPTRMPDLRPRFTAKQEWKNRIKRWRAAIRRLGIWSLVLAVAAPVSLHLLDMFLFRSAERAMIKNKVAWSYGHWFFDFINAYSSVVLSLCCWFCWAERDLSTNGFFHRKLDPAKLLRFYLGFIVLNAAWEPIVFDFGALKAGLLACVMKTWFAGAIAWLLIDISMLAFVQAFGWYKDPMFLSPSCMPTFWVVLAMDEFILTSLQEIRVFARK